MMGNVSSGRYYDSYKCSKILNRIANNPQTNAHSEREKDMYRTNSSEPNRNKAFVVRNFIGTFRCRYKNKAVMTHNARARDHLSEWWNFSVRIIANVSLFRLPCTVEMMLHCFPYFDWIESNKRINCRILL